MPTSNLAVAPYVINMVETVLPHDRVLDVGPGWGKYAVLLREYLNVKPSRVEAVEAWTPYVADHQLGRLYDQVWHGSAGDPPDMWWRAAVPPPLPGVTGMEARAGDVLAGPDLVLMVDVLEHMTEPQAAAVVAMCPQARVVICTPAVFFDNGPGLPPTEEHVSHWTPAKVKALGRPVEHLATEHGALLARLGPARG